MAASVMLCSGCSLQWLHLRHGLGKRPGETAQQTSGPVPSTPRAMGRSTARLRWTPPPLDAAAPAGAEDVVAGYRIYVGPRPGSLWLEAQLPDPRATTYVVRRLPSGTHWFTVTSYTRLGVESESPPPVSKNVR